MSLETNVSSAFTRVATEFKTLRTGLTGNNTGSLAATRLPFWVVVSAAINELDAAIDALTSSPGGAVIADGPPSGSSVWSSSKTNTEITTAVSNLVNGAGPAVDTLKELADLLAENDSDIAALVTSIAGKADAAHTHTSSQITDFGTAVDGRVAAAVPSASETVQGKVELATTAETTAGTDTARAVTPAGVKAVGDTKAPLSHTHTTSQVSDFATATDARVNTLVPAASDTAAGKVELATTTEATTGTDTTRAVTPAGLKAVADTKANTSHTQTASTITDFATAADARVNTLVPTASTTASGKVELATDAEAQTGTDATRAVTPANLASVVGTANTNFVATFEAGLIS